MFDVDCISKMVRRSIQISLSCDLTCRVWTGPRRGRQRLTPPEAGVKTTSSPTSKGLDERMMRPVKRFSRISLPARPTARPPTPPIASTELTAPCQIHLNDGNPDYLNALPMCNTRFPDCQNRSRCVVQHVFVSWQRVSICCRSSNPGDQDVMLPEHAEPAQCPMCCCQDLQQNIQLCSLRTVRTRKRHRLKDQR